MEDRQRTPPRLHARWNSGGGYEKRATHAEFIEPVQAAHDQTIGPLCYLSDVVLDYPVSANVGGSGGRLTVGMSGWLRRSPSQLSRSGDEKAGDVCRQPAGLRRLSF